MKIVSYAVHYKRAVGVGRSVKLTLGLVDLGLVDLVIFTCNAACERQEN